MSDHDAARDDTRARREALDPERSFIVQAPAGSGKTGLLTQRYLTLLAGVEAPEEVVAVTFTRKAAGEMRNRILEALESAAGPAPEADHERLTWELARAAQARAAALGWRLQEAPGRLRILTIDALNAALTRQMPFLSRFGASPGIAEDAAPLHREAARATLQELETGERWSESVRALLLHLDNNWAKVEELLAAMLARRDQWLRHLMDSRLRRDDLEEALAHLVTDALEALPDLMGPALAERLLELTAYAAANLRESGADSPLRRWDGRTVLPGTAPDDLPLWLGLSELLLTSTGGWRRQVTAKLGFPAPSTARERGEKERRKAMKEALIELLAGLEGEEPLRAALDSLRRLPPPRYGEAQWQVLGALAELLPVAVAQLRLVFQARGQVDFIEVAWGALAALGEAEVPTDLALALDYRIRHLLVDEFQDTSQGQYALLERLTAGWTPGDGHTLFVVGDPMQSIYRFREAEVGLYLRARREGLGPLPLEPLTLSRNFRSQAGVVDWVNEAFARVLPKTEDLATGAVTYARASPTRVPLSGSAVTMHPFLGKNHEAEAAQVAALVQSAQTELGTTAVLVRGRTHLAAIVPRLQAAGLRFRAIEIEALGTRPVVQDLYALTRALLHPADRVAWLALLRAPWCGLSVAGLAVLAEEDHERPVWDLLQEKERLARLAPAERKRLDRVRSVLAEALALRGRRPLRRWVEGCWLALGGPACQSEATALADARVFLEMLEGLEEGGEPADLSRLGEQMDRLFAQPDSEAGPELQLMTIHKSKGLEFDTVILPGLGRIPRRESERLLLWLERPRPDDRSDLLLAPIRASGAERDPIYAYLAELDRTKGRHEDGRLLYVAVTRARRRCHLLGHVPVKDGEAGAGLGKPAGDSLLARLWPVVEPAFQEALACPAAVDEPEFRDAPRAQLMRLADGWQLPPPPPEVAWRPAAAEAPREAEPPVEYLWAGETARHVGIVVHRILQNLGQRGVFPDEEELQALAPASRAALAQRGVPGTELDGAAEKVLAAVAGCLADERGRWILDSSHDGARCEYPLSGFVGGRLVNAVVDRTFVDVDGVRWIIDYKTGTHEGGGVDAFLDREQERYRSQLEFYASLFRRLEDRPIRLGLYFPLLAGWREWAPEGGEG